MEVGDFARWDEFKWKLVGASRGNRMEKGWGVFSRMNEDIMRK